MRSTSERLEFIGVASIDVVLFAKSTPSRFKDIGVSSDWSKVRRLASSSNSAASPSASSLGVSCGGASSSSSSIGFSTGVSKSSVFKTCFRESRFQPPHRLYC